MSVPPDVPPGPPTGGPAAAGRRRDQAFAVLTAFLALFSIVGLALYGLPFFYDFFVRDLGWTRQQVTSGNALSKLIIGPLFGFFAGVIIDRFGPRRLMLAGILIAGLALVGLGGTATLLAFYSFYFLNALGNVCGGPLPNQVLLSGWFDAGRGKAMGVAYLGIGIGGMLVPQIAHALTEALGWRTALGALGVLMVVVAFPVAFFVREPPRPTGTARAPAPDDRASGAGRAAESLAGAPSAQAAAVEAAPAGASSIGAVLRRPAFYLLALGSMASIGAIGGTVQNLKLYLAGDRGLGQGEAADVLSIVLLGSLVGRVLMGWLADRWPKRRVMLLIYVIVAATIPLFAQAPSVATLEVAAFLFGVGLGGDYMIIPLMAAELFGLRLLGRVMGIVITGDGVAEAVVPMAVAALRDRAGSYGPGFVLLVALAALGAAGIALLPRAGHRKS
jgi:sugar phosphate permease